MVAMKIDRGNPLPRRITKKNRHWMCVFLRSLSTRKVVDTIKMLWTDDDDDNRQQCRILLTEPEPSSRLTVVGIFANRQVEIINIAFDEANNIMAINAAVNFRIALAMRTDTHSHINKNHQLLLAQ
jgi:hypothetical protein